MTLFVEPCFTVTITHAQCVSVVGQQVEVVIDTGTICTRDQALVCRGWRHARRVGRRIDELQSLGHRNESRKDLLPREGRRFRRAVDVGLLQTVF